MTLTAATPALRRIAVLPAIRALLARLFAHPATLDQRSAADLEESPSPADPTRWHRLNGTAQDAATRLQLRAGLW